ncbi:MAG: hypothetical protein AMXMBFR13_19510 [Phycisphaerae bacterium]
MQSLTDKAMLARLSITQWSARKTDKRVTAEVHAAHQASADAGRYNKALVSADALRAIQQAATAGRETHYRFTLPWRDDGARILPAKAYLDYTADMRRLRAEFDAAVDAFCVGYPDYVEDARHRLNGMFNPAEYPNIDKIRAKFSWNVVMDPLPTGEDFRVSLADADAERIRQEIDQRTRQALADGLADAWKRLHDGLQHAAERLSDPNAIFRDSLIGNLQELCSVLPLLNFNDDPDLESARKSVETRLATLDPEQLRRMPLARAKAAQDAQSIMADMAAFMGGAS